MLGTSREPYSNVLQTHGFWIDQKGGHTPFFFQEILPFSPSCDVSKPVYTPPSPVHIHIHTVQCIRSLPWAQNGRAQVSRGNVYDRWEEGPSPLPQRQSLPFVNRDTKTAAGVFFFCSPPFFSLSLFLYFLHVRCHRFISLRRLSHRRSPFFSLAHLKGRKEGKRKRKMEEKESGAGGKAVPLKI